MPKIVNVEIGEMRERLARVERKMRRYQAALVSVALIAVVGAGAPSLLGAAKVDTIIRAKAFEVVDDAGAVRASLAMGVDNDRTGLILYDKVGKLRAGLVAIGDHAALGLYEAEKLRAEMETNSDGAGIVLNDKAEKPRVRLATNDDDTALSLYDKAGKQRVGMGTNGDGEVLGLFDKAGKPRADLAADNDHAGLALYRENGSVLWETP
jgi:hypothetical protein